MSLTKEQLAMRRTMITATDMVKLAGVDPGGRNRCDVYASKFSDADDEAGPAAAMGHRLEPIALAYLAETKGLTLTPGTTERHPIITWLGATPDANVMANGVRIAVAEAKAVGFRMAHYWGEDGDAIPEYVHVQAQSQMIVARVKLAHVVALLGTEGRCFVVEHDDDLAGVLLQIGEDFWTKHILARVPPPVDGSESARRMLRAAWPKNSTELLSADAEAEDWARAFIHARDEEKAWRAKKELAEQALCARIGEAEGVIGPNWKATWKWGQPVEVAAHVRAASRRFTFTEQKKAKRAA